MLADEEIRADIEIEERVVDSQVGLFNRRINRDKIKTLKDELGVRLFQRESNGIQLLVFAQELYSVLNELKT
jgi:hypothetical protein